MSADWIPGNAISLLENGDAFFARIIEVISQAEREILLETYILCDDPVGRKVQRVLIDAANRGVFVSVLVDGYGGFHLPRAFIDEMLAAGIYFHFYHPPPRWLRIRANIFKRLHRKILTVDERTAFIGGINIEHDHASDYGPDCKQDYAAELQGPVAAEIAAFAREALRAYSKQDIRFVEQPAAPGAATPAGEAQVLFLTRDNDRLRTTIETEYLQRIRAARHRITICNCYFFPSYSILKALRGAARRGVKVCLLTQGKPDSILAKRAAYTLYNFLVESHIQVYEYWERPLHGKIAAIDYDWATVGSSNLDPLSFCLNLEANVFVRDTDFNAVVHERIQALIDHSEVREINQSWIGRRTLLKGLQSALIYHLLRHLPGLARRLRRLQHGRRSSPLPTRAGNSHDPGSGV